MSTDTSTQKTNFLGIPIDGDITRGSGRVAQRPLSELEPLLRAVIEDPTIHSFGWIQYTPFFNDGEPCTFSMGEPWFRTVEDVAASGTPKQSGEESDDEDEDDEDYDEDDDDSFTISGYRPHPTLGHREVEYVGDWPNRKPIVHDYVGPDAARYDRVKALSDAINSGAFEDVFLEAFGDHCRVQITANEIVIDEYSHN